MYDPLTFNISVYIHHLEDQGLGTYILCCNSSAGTYQHVTIQDFGMPTVRACLARPVWHKRQFQGLFGAYSLTNKHVMAVVGRPNMCGVPV